MDLAESTVFINMNKDVQEVQSNNMVEKFSKWETVTYSPSEWEEFEKFGDFLH